MADSSYAKAMSRLQLNPKEQQLRELLVDVARYIDQAPARSDIAKSKKPEPTVLRWAGGWVRDRVLGTQSYDIDVAINNMTGYTFATQIQKFCAVEENRARHGMSPQDVGYLHMVKKNPEKSKNLETGSTKLFGLELDLVNLRKEIYKGDSRNPEMDFGTAEEDAERRDATINALFYNLQTGELEDFVGGLQDMEAKVIRTPLDPLQTFHDDPLRVLRLVRFAARLDFAIDPETEKAMADQRILKRFQVVITRERVGQEVEKMLRGKRPKRALELMDKFGLYHAVFTDPAQSAAPKPPVAQWKAVYNCLDALGEQGDPLFSTLVTSAEEQYLAWLLAALVPCSQIPEPASGVGTSKKTKTAPWATVAVREGIKAPSKVCEMVTAASRNRAEIRDLRDVVSRGGEECLQRDTFGLAIVRWNSRGMHWKLQVLFAVLVDVWEHASRAEPQTWAHVLVGWQAFLDHLSRLNLLDAPLEAEKRLVNGKQLSEALGLKPGPWMAKAVEVCLAWQFRNPDDKDPAAAIEEVRRRKTELGIVDS